MNTNIKTGVIRTYWDQEKTILCKEYFICDGKKEGIYKHYYTNGQLLSEVNFIDDKKNGIGKTYCINGQLLGEINYIDDKKNGMQLVA